MRLSTHPTILMEIGRMTLDFGRLFSMPSTNSPTNPHAWLQEITFCLSEALKLADEAGEETAMDPSERGRYVMGLGVAWTEISRGITPEDPEAFHATVVRKTAAAIKENPLRYQNCPALLFTTCYLYAHVEHALIPQLEADTLIAYLESRFLAGFPN